MTSPGILSVPLSIVSCPRLFAATNAAYQRYELFSDRRALLDVTSAAEYLTFSEHFIRCLVRERRVAVIHLGRHVCFDPAGLDAYVVAGRRAADR